MTQITILGAGLAGAEAAWQAANLGCEVLLYEMRPVKMTPAHHTGEFAELVCSNSLRAAQLENAVGLLKEEMRTLNSLIMACADAHRVPAGGALAVDREEFSKAVTAKLYQHPRVKVIREEITSITPNVPTIIATGPLTSHGLSEEIARITGKDYLYFYDAAAPIVTAESVNMEIAFRQSRYNKGDDDYLNCPLTEEEYHRFYEALVSAEVYPLKEFEKEIFFEGCMPVEEMARRGRQTLAFGPMKPVGIIDPRTGNQPYAVVQLRQDNAAASLYNLVGFQTHLKWNEQRQVFSMIPGLEHAEFVRYGVMHRNTFINSPMLLLPTLQMKSQQSVFFAGQITGVEGYVESASNGLVAGINAARLVQGKECLVFPAETAVGSLCRYITSAPSGAFQPMNITFGIMPPWEKRLRNKKEKNQLIARRALDRLKQFKEEIL